MWEYRSNDGVYVQRGLKARGILVPFTEYQQGKSSHRVRERKGKTVYPQCLPSRWEKCESSSNRETASSGNLRKGSFIINVQSFPTHLVHVMAVKRSFSKIKIFILLLLEAQRVSLLLSSELQLPPTIGLTDILNYLFKTFVPPDYISIRKTETDAKWSLHQ